MVHYSPEHKRFYDDRYWWKDHEYKPSKRNRYNVVTSRADPMIYLARRVRMAKYMQKYDYMICDSGWTKGQGWIGLYRAWQGFIINAHDNNIEGMEMYAKVIRKIQKDLKIAIREFPGLKVAALEYINDPENNDLLEEKADELNKDVDDLNSEDVLNIMLDQDRLAYELAGMQY